MTQDRMPSACPSCGASCQPDARFCAACGHALSVSAIQAHSGSWPKGGTSHVADGGWREGERKLVTILFADVRGSLAMIERLDPEQAQQLLDEITSVLAVAAHRFGGTVSQNLGDGIMVLFGAPHALEDHADRACLAALAMIEDVARLRVDTGSSERLELRIGMSSGEVVVRAIPSDLVEHYSAIGKATHIAARLQQGAEPGRPLLSGTTRSLLTRSFALRELGVQPVRGLSEQLELFELLGSAAATTPAPPRPGRAPTPLVGREAQLEVLLAEAARAGLGLGRLMLLVGEPGVGKSRLARELCAHPSLDSWRRVTAWTGLLGKATPWQPLGTLIRALFGLAPGIDAAAAQATLTAQLGVLDESLRALAVPLTACLDLTPEDQAWSALEPPLRRQRIQRSLLTVFQRLAVESPLVLVIEDLHGADNETLAFLELLVAELASSRLLVIATARPPFAPDWAENPNVQRLPLEPLDGASAGRLLSALLGPGAATLPLHGRLIERAGGNPLFLEELAHAVAERHGEALLPEQDEAESALPSSLQALLSARIDRLDWPQRRLLRAASVLGDVIEPELLAGLVSEPADAIRPALAELCALGFLGAGQPGGTCWFRHALIREATYAGLLKRQRQALHRQVVMLLQAGGTTASAATLAMLGHHASAAEIWDVAFAAHRELAQRALERSAARDAIAAAEQARRALDELERTRPVPVDRIDLHYLLASAQFALAQQAKVLEGAREGLRLAEQIGDDRRIVRGLTIRALHQWMRGEIPGAVEDSRRARDVAERLQDSDLRINTTLRHAFMLQARGDYAGSLEPMRWAAAAIPPERRCESFGVGALAAPACHASPARSLSELAEPEATLKHATLARDIAAEVDHVFTHLYIAREVGLALVRLERAGESIALIDQALTRFTPTPNDLLYPALFSLLGFAWILCGAPAKGVELIRRSIDAAEELGLMVRRSQQATWLAEGLLAVGQTAEAETVARQAVARAVACHEYGHQAWALRTLARTLRPRDAAVAAQIERTATALAMRHGLLTLLQSRVGEADPLAEGSGAGDVVPYPEGGRAGRVSRA